MRTGAALLCAVAVLLQAGCAGPDGNEQPVPALPEAEQQRIYGVYLDAGRSAWFDRDGEELEEPGTLLYDTLTGVPYLRTTVQYERTGEQDANGAPVVRTLSQLWDLDGNLLYDWQEGEYAAAFGEYVILRDPMRGMVEMGMVPQGFESCLWNYRSGQPKYGEVSQVTRLDGEQLLLSDVWGRVLGVVGPDGNAKGAFPVSGQYHFAQPWREYLLAYRYDGMGNPQDQVLLRPDFSVVMSAPSLQSYKMNGPYLIRGDEVVSVPDGDSWELQEAVLVIGREHVGTPV